ncbi:hypothetical protein JCM17823_11030 [Halorubrum gandharaense]
MVSTRDLPSAVALLVFVAVGYTAGGVTGGVAAVAAALVALVAPVTGGFAVGQLALLAMVTIDDVQWVVVTQLALVVLLTEPARERNATRVTVATLVAFGLLAGVIGVGLQRSLVAAAGGVGLAVAAGLYTAHRYERVRLGLVDGEPNAESTTTTGDADGATTPTPPDNT